MRLFRDPRDPGGFRPDGRSVISTRQRDILKTERVRMLPIANNPSMNERGLSLVSGEACAITPIERLSLSRREPVPPFDKARYCYILYNTLLNN